MNEYHTTDKLVQEIGRAAFPDYKGKKFRVITQTHPINVKYNNYWDGGTRSWYNFVRLDTMESFGTIPDQHPWFNKAILGADKVQLVPGLVCVEHTHFQGKDLGLTIKVHPENAPKLLPDNINTTTREEKIVLVATRSYKNTYGGRTNIRYKNAHRETGILPDEWETAKQSCINKGWLNKAGAITNTGKNIVQNTRLYELKNV